MAPQTDIINNRLQQDISGLIKLTINFIRGKVCCFKLYITFFEGKLASLNYKNSALK
jgi:hypothetical protein